MALGTDIISNAPGANTTPPSAAPQDQQGTTFSNAPSQDNSVSAQNNPAGTPQAKSPSLEDKLINGSVTPSAQPDPVANHPLVKKAGLLNAVAQTLAGGPRYTEKIDDQGNRVRTPVKMSGRDISMAIVMEALSGSLSGLAAGRGKGGGAAAMAGFQQVQKQTQQLNDAQDQKAQQDFVNKASAYSANLRTRAMAQEIGMRDEADHKAWIEQHAPTVNYLRENAAGAIVQDNVSEDAIKNPDFTKEAIAKGYIAIPTSYVPRFDAEGNHYSKDGVPLHDNTFMIVDPSKLQGGKLGVTPDLLSKAQAWALPGFTNRSGAPISSLGDIQLRIGTVVDTTNKISALEAEQKDLNGYYDYLNSKNVKGPDGKPLVAPDLKALVRQNPTLIGNITGPWANTFGESPSAAFKAVKDATPGKGALLNLYGGTQLLDKYDLLKDSEKKTNEKTAEANVEVKKERDLIPIKAATAGAEAKARAAAAATSSKNEDGTWNPTSIPVSLVEANMDPSQLSKRNADYNQKLQDANAYSMQKYGKPFDIAQATTDYKQANNPQVQSMLKMVGAMSAPNGELAIAVNAAKALPQMNSGTLNKVFNITETQFGSDAATNFHTAMIGFSDLYAKVMGGGAGTDALRQSAMDVLKDGYSRGQIAGSIKVLQQQIEARKAQMVGENPYLRKQFGGQAQAQTPNNVQSPPASLLKEGVNTKFANGQVWSLRSGQPVQVQ